MRLFKKRARDDDLVDMNDRSPQLGLRFKDLAVLKSLSDNGADLTQPRHVVYYSYYLDADHGEQAAARARGAGFTVEVRAPSPEVPDQWAVVAERHGVVLAPDFVRSSDDLFQGLADELGGDYDGWEAAV